MQVVFISRKAQHGKDTSAIYLKEILMKRGKRVLITHYGDILKHICKQFFDWNGKKDTQGRELLQSVGTDSIRKSDPNYFVTFTQTLLNIFPDTWDYVLIPDCRFPNEVDTFPGFHLRIVRSNFKSPLSKEQQMHISETALDNHPYDRLIKNNGSLFRLHKELMAFAISMGWIENDNSCSHDLEFCERFCMGETCPLLTQTKIQARV